MYEGKNFAEEITVKPAFLQRKRKIFCFLTFHQLLYISDSLSSALNRFIILAFKKFKKKFLMARPPLLNGLAISRGTFFAASLTFKGHLPSACSWHFHQVCKNNYNQEEK